MKLFVTVGNAPAHFDRMLRMVDEVQARLSCDGVCQYGTSDVHPRGLVAKPTLSKLEFESAMRTSDAVICHAGVGTIWSAIEARHKPLVIPRRHSFGEHVNDHQVDICRVLAQTGRIVVVRNAEELERNLVDLAAGLSDRPRTPLARDLSRLDPVARALADLAREAANASKRRPSHLLEVLAAMGPPLDRLRMKP